MAAVIAYCVVVSRRVLQIQSTDRNSSCFRHRKNSAAKLKHRAHLGAVRGFLEERCQRGQAWVENDPCWFVIDRKRTLTCAYPPNFSTGANFYEKDIDRVLEELSKAAHE